MSGVYQEFKNYRILPTDRDSQEKISLILKFLMKRKIMREKMTS